MKDTLSYQIKLLLKLNKVTIDFEELYFQIQSHPTYPSLHAVTGVLDHFNIANLALDIPQNPETLQQLPSAFLAQVEIDKQKEFVVIKKIKAKYQLFFSSKRKTIISEIEFAKQFTGIVLVIDKDESKTTNNIKTSNKLSKVFGWAALFMFGLTFLFSEINVTNSLLLFLSIIGVYISINILKQEDGETSVLGDAFCSEVSEKKNCNAVLVSKGATVYGDLKLSDLSIVYFTGLTLSTFILTLNSNSTFFINILSLSALPVTIYSIYYQYKIIKKWCALCLAIVGIIWLLSLVSVINFYPEYQLSSLLIIVLTFSVTIAFWLYQSNLLESYKSLKQTKAEHLKLIQNFDLFNSQLNNSKTIDTSIPFLDEIVLGNPNSKLHIIAITNPLCGYCKPVHNVIEQILEQYNDTVKVTIRFNVDTKNEQSKAVQIALHLLDLYNTNIETALNAMHDIYGDLSAKEWIKKWKLKTIEEKHLKTLSDSSKWCRENDINFTPELLINGKPFPKMYNRKNLLYFMENLEEQVQINNPQLDTKAIIKQSS